MYKSHTTVLLFIILNTATLMAQQMSEKALTKVARRDVGRHFVLTKAEYKLFKQDKRNITSDLFKPKPNTVSDTSLLADSVYVKAYRNFAYINARSKADSGIVIVVGTGIIVSCLALTFIVLSELGQIDFNFPM
jgi:hypothetical protein